MWKKSKIDETNARLKDIRGALEFRIVNAINDKIDFLASREYQALDGVSRNIIGALLDSHIDLQTTVSHHAEDGIRLQREIHQRTISAIQRQPFPLNTDEVRWALLSLLGFRAMQD